MDSSFQLTPSEHNRIYENTIERISFLDTHSVDKPKMVIVGAQTGAGKSRLVELSIKEFGDATPVTVNTDDLRAYHPKFDEIVMMDDTRSAERTHHDASGWKNKLLSRCIETKRNVVLEGVFKDSKSLTETVELAKANGYEVVVRIVAAHARYSVWGINRRYEKEKIVRGHGRYVPLAYHYECYEKLLESVDSVEQQKLANVIEIFDRDANCLYSNSLVNGAWKDAPNARAAIEAERNRKLNDKERNQYIESWQRVFEYLEKRHASAEETSHMRSLANRFIEELKRST